jgi:hypothetical protein
MELLKELLRSDAGDELVAEIDKLRHTMTTDLHVATMNSDLGEIRKRAGRVEGLNSVVRLINTLRKKDA